MPFKSIPLVGVTEVAAEYEVTGERIRQLIKEQILCPDFVYIPTNGRRAQYFWIQLPARRTPNGRKRNTE